MTTKPRNISIENVDNTDHTNAYDKVNYESYSFKQTSPSYIGAIGKIFGMNPVDPKKARVLEIGCAAGMNLIPLANLYKDAEFVGIDLAKTQIDDAKKFTKELKLKNIEFKHMSITDLDESMGKFDYIIVHGIYSWVPEEVRNSILENGKKLLSDQGILYVSYNALPGWNMVKSIRDMMIYHASNFETPQDKVVQAKAMLTFVKDQLKDTDSPYAKFLTQELDLLQSQRDSYVFHDHIEGSNTQFYLHQFVSDAKSHGLQYLGDTSLASMYVGNYGDEANKTLSQIQDIVRQEQYMDFITNRRFRTTLLCNDNIPLKRAIDLNSIKDLYFQLKIAKNSQITNEDLLSETKGIKFSLIDSSKDNSIEITGVELKCAFKFISKNGLDYFSIDEIFENTQKVLKEHGKSIVDKDVFFNSLVNVILKMIFSGLSYVSLNKIEFSNKIESDNPKVWDVALNQIENNFQKITNKFHETFAPDMMESRILFYSDGTRTIDQISEKLLEHFKKGDLNANLNGKNMEISDVEKNIRNWVQNTLNTFAARALLDN